MRRVVWGERRQGRQEAWECGESSVGREEGGEAEGWRVWGVCEERECGERREERLEAGECEERSVGRIM